MDAVSAADTAWVLGAFAAVTLMIPGLAMFYGGMVSVRTTLNMAMMVFGAVALTGVLWVIFGYSTVFGTSIGGWRLFGDPFAELGLGTMLTAPTVPGLPPALFAAFQLLFAAITVALIAGAVADRMKFGAWMTFAGLWATLVYFPVAHWVFTVDSKDGSVVGGWIINSLKAVDFAGGTAVHINAGIAALALAVVLGKRRTFPNAPRPHSLPLTVAGAGLLMFGWFGFNGGSALTAGNSASVVVLTTLAASCAGICGWLMVEKFREGRATSLGAASGLIAALVAITPACGAVSPLGALGVGALAGAACCYAVSLKYRLGYDDSLDVVGVHLVGGVLGTLVIGLIADPAAPSAATGLFYGGGLDLLLRQAAAAGAILAYSGIVTTIIALVLKVTIGLRVDTESEHSGVDIAVHGETAYVMDSLPLTNHPVRESDAVTAAETILTR